MRVQDLVLKQHPDGPGKPVVLTGLYVFNVQGDRDLMNRLCPVRLHCDPIVEDEDAPVREAVKELLGDEWPSVKAALNRGELTCINVRLENCPERLVIPADFGSSREGHYPAGGEVMLHLVNYLYTATHGEAFAHRHAEMRGEQGGRIIAFGPAAADWQRRWNEYKVARQQLTDGKAIAGRDEEDVSTASPQRYSHDFSLMFNVSGSAYESAEECLEHELTKVLSALHERVREAEECPLEAFEEVNSFPE
jgi:hypothetical protein